MWLRELEIKKKKKKEVMLLIQKSAQFYAITNHMTNCDWCKFDGGNVRVTPAPILTIDLELSKFITNSFRNC